MSLTIQEVAGDINHLNQLASNRGWAATTHWDIADGANLRSVRQVFTRADSDHIVEHIYNRSDNNPKRFDYSTFRVTAWSWTLIDPVKQVPCVFVYDICDYVSISDLLVDEFDPTTVDIKRKAQS